MGVEKNRKMKLERCMRFLPHFNDDGGFFVAILRKTKKLTDVNQKNERRMRNVKERTRNVKGQHHIKNMDNIFLGENLADFDRFKNDLGLDMKSDNVIKYSEKKSGGHMLWYMNDALANIVKNNHQFLTNVTHLGLGFARADNLKESKHHFILKSSAIWPLRSILSFKSKVNIELDDLKLLISEQEVEMSSLSDVSQKQLTEKEFGNIVLCSEKFDLYISAFYNTKKIFPNMNDASRKTVLDILEDD